MKIVMNETDSAAKITGNFLSPLQPKTEDFRMTDINSLLSELLLKVGNTAANLNISVRKSLGEDIPHSMMDAGQVSQALLNVIENALQAMPEGGFLTITSAYSVQEEEICVTVSDTGEGIPPQNMDKVFKPFFSTRTDGLGLGLTLTKRIVQHHNGRVILKSIVDIGTTVFLYFPAQPNLDMYSPGFFRVSAPSPQKEGSVSRRKRVRSSHNRNNILVGMHLPLNYGRQNL